MPLKHVATCRISPDFRPLLCKNCKFFAARSAQCRKFGAIDIVTGKSYLEDARDCRSCPDKCGPYAIHFEANDEGDMPILRKLIKFIKLADLVDHLADLADSSDLDADLNKGNARDHALFVTIVVGYYIVMFSLGHV